MDEGTENATPFAEDMVVPACAQSSHGFGTWRAAEVHAESINIVAGFAGREPQVAQSAVYAMDEMRRRFVLLQKHARWFIHAIGGRRATKNDVAAVRELDGIREKFLGMNNTTAVAGTAAVSDTAAVADDKEDDVDPMDELMDVAAFAEKPTVKPAKQVNSVSTSSGGSDDA